MMFGHKGEKIRRWKEDEEERKEGERDAGGKKEEREPELERRRNVHLPLYEECRPDSPRYRELPWTLRE